MPTSLITGGAGFLGSHMCERLITEGHQVICVDNLLTGSMENIGHLLDQKAFTFIEHDIIQPIDLNALMPKTQNLDYILHFASPASPKDYLQYPIETMKVGAFGTHNLLELAKKKKAVFLLASTSEVYGDPELNPQPEDYRGRVDPIGPRSVYDEAKRYAEALTMAYHRKHGVDIRIARIFNTYGPRLALNDGRVISNFITQALRGDPMTIYGDGSHTRSFCYVDDLIDGIHKLLLSDVVDPVNLGNPAEISILDLAREIIEITRSKSEIIFNPLPVDDPRVRRPDISRAKSLLNWDPVTGRKNGIEKTEQYFKGCLEDEHRKRG